MKCFIMLADELFFTSLLHRPHPPLHHQSHRSLFPLSYPLSPIASQSLEESFGFAVNLIV